MPPNLHYYVIIYTFTQIWNSTHDLVVSLSVCSRWGRVQHEDFIATHGLQREEEDQPVRWGWPDPPTLCRPLQLPGSGQAAGGKWGRWVRQLPTGIREYIWQITLLSFHNIWSRTNIAFISQHLIKNQDRLFVFSQLKLQALVYDILPPFTAVFSYVILIGSWKLSANEQFFIGTQTVVSLL